MCSNMHCNLLICIFVSAYESRQCWYKGHVHTSSCRPLLEYIKDRYRNPAIIVTGKH